MAEPLPSEYSPDSASPTGAPTGYSPTEEEQATVRLVERLLTEGKKAKEPYDRKWLSNYKFFKGKQWPERRPSYRHSEVLNYIFGEVQTVMVLLTDNRPNIEVLPEDPTDFQFSEILSQIIKSKWDTNNWSSVVAEAIVDAAIYGTGLGCVEWKPELLQGLGDFTFETEDIFYFFPDPNARSRVNDEYCDWVIRARPTDVKKLKAKYPDKADFIKADLGDLSSVYNDKEFAEEVRYKSPTDNRVIIDSDRSIKSGRPDQVLEICAYLKSDEMTEEQVAENTDPDTGLVSREFQTKKKYPNGRKIVIANGVLLEDGENPYTDGRFPFARLVDHAMPREFWGVGEVDQLKSPQMIVNKLISYVLDVLTIMGNPIWVVDTTAGIEVDNLTNQPGLVVEKNPNTEVRREEGVQLQPFVMETLQFMSERVLSKLGSTADVSKGVAPTENASGYAIAQLQEAAQTKIRGKSRNVEFFLKDIGDLMVDRILQFYTIPRIVRLTNAQEAAQYFKFSVSDAADETGELQKIATVQQYEQDPLSGAYIEQPPMMLPLKSKLDTRISVGSSLPFAKLENRTLAEKLFDKGIIDAEEYLNQIEYPNRDKIIERMRQNAVMAPAMPAPDAMPPPAAAGAPV